jgi:hypothetical protein
MEIVSIKTVILTYSRRSRIYTTEAEDELQQAVNNLQNMTCLIRLKRKVYIVFVVVVVVVVKHLNLRGWETCW